MWQMVQLQMHMILQRAYSPVNIKFVAIKIKYVIKYYNSIGSTITKTGITKVEGSYQLMGKGLLRSQTNI